MKEKLIIKNFAGIDYLEIELNKINILIGPQASGKSITAKLFYYFKSFIKEIRKGIEQKEIKREIDKNHLNRFINYFPKDSWPEDEFSIEYFADNITIKVYKELNKPLKLTYSDELKSFFIRAKNILKKELEKSRAGKNISHSEISEGYSKEFYKMTKELHPSFVSDDQYFVPAGRSFFSNIQSGIFSFLSSNKSLDPFLIEFGSFYETFKIFGTKFDEDNFKLKKEVKILVNGILNSDYLREKGKDYLLHVDKRKVNLSYASSGQQESLPLLIILQVFLKFSISGVLYIEEPEAHLFPNAQNNIIQLLSRVFNSKVSDLQIILITHSPYILSSFNNLVYAGSLDEKLSESKIKMLEKIIPKEERIDPKLVSAYSLDLGGKKKNLIDKETGLISQNYLDDVSNKISTEFGKLLDLEF